MKSTTRFKPNRTEPMPVWDRTNSRPFERKQNKETKEGERQDRARSLLPLLSPSFVSKVCFVICLILVLYHVESVFVVVLCHYFESFTVFGRKVLIFFHGNLFLVLLGHWFSWIWYWWVCWFANRFFFSVVIWFSWDSRVF